MRFKPVPEPPSDLEAVAAILEAVPATAGAVDDCCAHLVAETRLEGRREAETWLVFLRALELVSAESAGYRRSRSESPSGDEPPFDIETDRARLRRAFRERVHGADAVLEALERADGPTSAADVRDEIPASERGSRSDRVEPEPIERVRRLLEWAVVLDLAERTADGDHYRTAPSLPSE